MRLYETTFILGPQADEATFDRQIKAISDLIERNQGKIVKEQRTGIRRLAYPIRKFTQGYYTRFIFEGNNTLLNELERFYKLEEPYIRFLTVVFEGDPEVDYESRFGHFRGGRGGRSYDSDSPRDRGGRSYDSDSPRDRGGRSYDSDSPRDRGRDHRSSGRGGRSYGDVSVDNESENTVKEKVAKPKLESDSEPETTD